MLRLKCALYLLVLVLRPAGAFRPAAHSHAQKLLQLSRRRDHTLTFVPKRQRQQQQLQPQQQRSLVTMQLDDSSPPMDSLAPPIPQLSWRRILFFMANPLALLPIASVAIFVFKLSWLGSAFSTATTAWQQGVLIALPMLLLNQIADKCIPALTSVTEASKVISLYALGGRLKPLRGLTAAVLISTAAAVAEEITFRGALQTGIEGLLRWATMPATLAASIACVVQAIVFGILHSYTPSPAYLITASVAGLAFGAAFTATHNLAVPIIMHFVIDVVGFSVCHYRVTVAGEAAQRKLMMMDSPIAASLRRVFQQTRDIKKPDSRGSKGR